jgi:L-cysteine S-thiosulfotransferase
MKKTLLALALPVTVLALHGCSMAPSSADYDKMTADIVQASFQERGIAQLDRLKQDDANRECAAADVAGQPIDEQLAKAIEATQMKTIRWPSDGRFLGDWKEGEKVAQSGRGLTWSDDLKVVSGGNCYNCHQITKEEISFGTIGPSLYNYGKLRGVTDPNSAAAKPMLEYTWGKLWNARAYNACSQMPRAGHKGILSEKDIRNVMALLLDPQSPVNR